MDVSKETLEMVLNPYFKECQYLQEAAIDYPSIKGRFHIPNSCYIQSTGHFNAVEMIICYNQLAYAMFAESLTKDLIREVPGLTMDEFKKYRLENSFIVRMDEVKFKKPIDPKKFYGNIKLTRANQREKTSFLFTDFEFVDNNSGKVSGEVLLAFYTD